MPSQAPTVAVLTGRLVMGATHSQWSGGNQPLVCSKQANTSEVDDTYMNTLKLVLCLGGSAGLSAYQDERTHSTRLQTQAFQHCHTVYLFAEHQQVHSRSDARATHVALPALNAPHLQQFPHSKG